MSNTKTTEQIFLSQAEKCSFCDSDLDSISKTESFIDKKITSVYDYGCGLQVMIFEEIVNNNKIIQATCMSCCSNRTKALDTVLQLKQKIKK